MRLIRLQEQPPIFWHKFLCSDVSNVGVFVMFPKLFDCRMIRKHLYQSCISLFVHQIGTLELWIVCLQASLVLRPYSREGFHALSLRMRVGHVSYLSSVSRHIDLLFHLGLPLPRRHRHIWLWDPRKWLGPSENFYFGRVHHLCVLHFLFLFLFPFCHLASELCMRSCHDLLVCR